MYTFLDLFRDGTITVIISRDGILTDAEYVLPEGASGWAPFPALSCCWTS